MMAGTSVLDDGDGVAIEDERIDGRGDGLAPGFSGMLSKRMMGGVVVFVEENRWLVRGRTIEVEGTVEEGLRLRV
ncbi:hypothetical protein D8674_008350 [Pyrus ussuriensis x Pyrus communis]|uniref:Uncharacterized protein n=1 Tax=Pyrus ussuriensis x Pyrus communis TaxID=2448454 RepID=A0A5N5HX66_9ROSA|nr:hypothetical protein D8674_008350 [Pyrus ussuriensis x Pyrus communis]